LKNARSLIRDTYAPHDKLFPNFGVKEYAAVEVKVFGNLISTVLKSGNF